MKEDTILVPVKASEEFHKVLLKHSIKNRAFFTSNDFHTIWDAMEEYKETTKSELLKEELEKRMPTSKKCIDLVKEIHLMDAELRPDSYIAEYIHTWIKSTLTQPDKE